MACPGGCVNGGGQLKPPAQTTRDEEGFKRDWESTGVSVSLDADDGPATRGVSAANNAKWGDREWTRKVEEVYWHGLAGLPTPPPSPQMDPSKRRDEKAGVADHLATVVLRDACQPTVGVPSWDSVMDADAEARRRTMFRTQYRAVESEVVGLAVKW
ncbi:hypothetical protein EUX98_g8952 [Antrodiella citrinella]|uniref:Iron hydrogenase large subunit C-terminal domain-containing protein n=1 Tax=Antrodiella citrinella TaxID=2447956 RepID=A0A4S4M0C3_9APHY|nr:hypothetical protein EUX98_g8952 [Antrodiella citrinella]